MSLETKNGTRPLFGRLQWGRRDQGDVVADEAGRLASDGELGGIARDDGVMMVAQARQANLLVAAFEGEIKGTVGAAVGEGEAVEQAAKEAIAAVNRVSDQAREVNEASAATVGNVETVASATEELAASEREVTSLVQRAEDLARNASTKAEEARRTVGELDQASKAINGIVVFIEDLARRTNMLALNASIEAQRAGVAGKGFAVVAGEVKDLAKQTANATRDIREKIAGIQKTSGEATDAIGAIVQVVDEIQSINGEVAASVTQQAAATAEISRNAQEVTMRVSDVTRNIGTIAREATSALELTQRMEQGTAQIAERLHSMRTRLGVVVGTSRNASKSLETLPVEIPATLLLDEGRRVEGHLTTLSATYCGFLPGEPVGAAPRTARIALPFLGELGGDAEWFADGCLRVTFKELLPATKETLSRLIGSLDIVDVDKLEIGETAVAQITAAFERAVDAGEVSLADLFDEDYQLLPDTFPVQHATRYLSFAERILPPIQEPLAAKDPKLVAVVAVDRNGYLPINLLRYSKPQGKDRVWNTANCRNKRLLNDPVGLTAARNRERFIMQTYIREFGVNDMRLMRDLAMPIHVKGRHWGAVRVTYVT